MKAAQGPIAFISFGDEIFAARIPVGVYSENRNLGANVMRWMRTAFAQNMRRHCRGCRFAVHSGDDDAAFTAHNCSQGFRATHDRFSRIARTHKNWIVAPDRGGENNKVGSGMLRAMLLIKMQTDPL